MSKILVIGIGPGGLDDMTKKAADAIEQCDIIYGYSTYIDLVKKHFPHKIYEQSAMTQETQRCEQAAQKAAEGLTVGLVSSGDSGIYGMAGIMLEVINSQQITAEIEIIPGVTSATAASAILGAPLMNDFAVISLSDLLTDWNVILKRLECAAEGDFVVCLYNPKSKKRVTQINQAGQIFLKHRAPDTPVGIVQNAGRESQCCTITTLKKMPDEQIDMFCVVIIGNSETYVQNGRMITPRGYSI